MKNNIPEGAKLILLKLNEHNHEAYLIGGSVRDLLMGGIPKDWDITTSATPREIKEIFSEYRTFEFGIKHGTISIIALNERYEVTTYREDGEYKDSRRPESIIFTKSLSQDMRRRDFTINAMAMDVNGEIIDLFDGAKDLKEKTIRCVGNPYERIGEDALRILRALRFRSQLGFKIEKHTDDAIFAQKNSLLNISKERIREEFDKIIKGKYATSVLREYRDIIALFIPEIIEAFGFDQCNPYHIYDVYEHTLKVVEKIENKESNRLMAFLHDLAKPTCFVMDKGWGHFYHHESKGAEIAREVLRRLKYDNETISDISYVIKIHGTVFNPSSKYARHKLNQIGEKRLRMLIDLEKADVKAQNPEITKERLKNIENFEELVNKVIFEEQCFSLKNLAIDGNELIKIGYKKGPIIGQTLNTLLVEVMNDEITNDKISLIIRAKEILNENEGD